MIRLRFLSLLLVVFQALAEAEALALQQQDMATMHQPVEQRCGHAFIAKHLRPMRKTTELGFSVAAAPDRSGGIVSLQGVPDVQAMVARLAAANVYVAERGGFLRISPHFYTSDSEIDLLLRALKDIRAQG